MYFFLASEIEVIGLLGNNKKERVNFHVPLKSYSLQRVSEWFDCLLRLIKSSLCMHTHSYLNNIESYTDYSNFQTIDKRLNSIKDIPGQIVLMGEALFWCKNVEKIIKNKSFEDFPYVMYVFLNLFYHVHNYIKIIS